eukprot:g3692.t1
MLEQLKLNSSNLTGDDAEEGGAPEQDEDDEDEEDYEDNDDEAEKLLQQLEAAEGAADSAKMDELTLTKALLTEKSASLKMYH